ncbi:predicted protein [Sclerotinia sclerotiorum 1980 UF-70]|uniref:Uncharacterized protein n=1 Tax=Sclerotinia sclerotiorum (strain ATCC 18683 / 1980 / Ss-1) TaxID=665079 RepID=A7EKX1_SCLS1|nr:predicted protein [Sclerotinia sclerotiorum 1980 UF-70]EDO03487.1 predicted protein [Sclerotinia sclerotiorum 1980 UF-70]
MIFKENASSNMGRGAYDTTGLPPPNHPAPNHPAPKSR